MSSPVLVTPSAHVLHGSEAAGNTSKAVEVVQDGATGLQVVRVSCGLGVKKNVQNKDCTVYINNRGQNMNVREVSSEP